jgi:hypothetical protein
MNMSLEFSEGNSVWSPVPKWADFLLQLGYKWPASTPTERRIALVSMPCDSAAAGLITLGATVRDLGNPNANNLDRHYDVLLQYARQFLEACQPCTLKACDPEASGCGYHSEVTGRVRSVESPRGTYQVSSRTDFANRQIAFARNGMTVWPKPQYATEWYIDGEPAPQLLASQGELQTAPYLQLIEGVTVLPANANKSYSGLCLAGRSAGEAPTRAACAAVSFRNGMASYLLPELLTIHGWSDCNVSRVTFFNALTERQDRLQATPALVIADGDGSFLKALARSEFRQSDVIGVIHRTMERDKLEAVGNKMLHLAQWYTQDAAFRSQLPPLPRGITLSVLRRGE